MHASSHLESSIKTTFAGHQMNSRTGSFVTTAKTSTYVCLTTILLFGLAAFGGGAANAAEPIDIRIPVRESEFDTVQSCHNDSNPDCRSCLAANGSSVSLAMYSILRKSLTTGGLDTNVLILPSPNSERSRKLIKDGLADIKIDWDFNIDPNPSVLKSAPIQRRGEIAKGIYVSHDTFARSSMTPISNVNLMRAVSIRNWQLDWKVLENLAPASLISAVTIEQMYALVDADRADFTLLEFANGPDMVRRYRDIRLFPMPGVKVILPASKHFMVSRHIPEVQKVITALNAGIETLHRNGFIHQCLVNSGIVNERVKDWTALNPLASPMDGYTGQPTQ